MLPQYTEWIKNNVPASTYGKCTEITEAMDKEFPELKRVRGWYEDAYWGKREHWWMLDPNSNIIDPTKSQFPDQHGDYHPLDESKPKPTGKCINCGGYCFNRNPTCSKECERQNREFMERNW